MVDPYSANAMQSRPSAGPVPTPLQTQPRPPNSMARPVAANGVPLPAGSVTQMEMQQGPSAGLPLDADLGHDPLLGPREGGYEQDPLLYDVESGDTATAPEDSDSEENDEEKDTGISALPGHMDHYCTNVIWILILPIALGVLYFPTSKAMNSGDVSKFFRGFDYSGRMCGRDFCNGAPCGRLTYFCAKSPEDFPDTAHPICVDSCPTSNLTSHVCWDAETASTVSLPDLPTTEFNMKCLQEAHAMSLQENEKKQQRLFKGLSRFKGANSIAGFLMDSLHSIYRAWVILVSTFFVALAVGMFYMLVLRYLSEFLIHASLLLMMIVPAVFGLFHLFKVFTSGGFHEVLHGNTEVQASFLSGIGGLCVAFVLCCTLAKISQGIATATGCIVATTECMFGIPSILFEPLASLLMKALFSGPMIALSILYVSTGEMMLVMGESEMNRKITLDGEQWAFLGYIVFMGLWLVEITHNSTQYVLAFVTERWYFTPYVDDVKVDLPHSCLVLEAVYNMLRYHLGSVILSAFLKTLFRVPKIIGFTFYLVGCCDDRKRGNEPEGKEGRSSKCSCRLLMRLLRKEGYMDMAITSAEYYKATQHAMFVLEDAAAGLVLNWTQLVFQVCGWAGTTSVCILFAQVMVSTTKYTDPLDHHFLNEPDSVVFVCAILGLSVSVSFMNVFDVVGDTILYCFALEEQRHKQQMAGKYDPYDEQTIFQKCTCRSKNGDGFFSWLMGYDDDKGDDHHHVHARVQYAPPSLLEALENAK